MYGFEGWLLKVNGNIFPTSLIRADTYKITPDQETDLDDYTDLDGVFHRNKVAAKATKIEFNVIPIRLHQYMKVKEILPGVDDDDEVEIEYWNPRTMEYQSGRAYIPDVSFEPYMIYTETNDILYKETRLAFIEYGEVR